MNLTTCLGWTHIILLVPLHKQELNMMKKVSVSCFTDVPRCICVSVFHIDNYIQWHLCSKYTQVQQPSKQKSSSSWKKDLKVVIIFHLRETEGSSSYPRWKGQLWEVLSLGWCPVSANVSLMSHHVNVTLLTEFNHPKSKKKSKTCISLGSQQKHVGYTHTFCTEMLDHKKQISPLVLDFCDVMSKCCSIRDISCIILRQSVC